ncbi:MAG: excinuclease ABC subunit C [Candidatus Staskawiczbacteria bacterium RIFOXYB2_FULL_32_9]|uniref:Excinuclease ABC subunit C n=1 Tax=Candidatus Staskawiczbacteria bacterium RIFOXYD1_FULL_32_13 TaxID=1802234 RepID=A0A1G2JPK3_9BACT|nr:MAG: Excinuclease ABC C subunit domain protein [Parcubacteria group bacterium GW2011_GWC2_32_10]OGZ79963.1 MAG: excinuclease ABC subunit C [Candidatus Staskawiczbacteria bacterium RIFOXYB1_FULL_32_11]OGZ83426.1 MAG: excinuclease ABC subunit C [Candidatus Staskawiczbacteria bacterium RIFOXYB2_FULL_32_9]OGZ86754.1 MAG: excinuclease ABC subunit C [Candidatus Staskawiczbacteria bacterium RIFOXYC2_FULL_32_10]OGZ89064.1 MAG: excinuclease ABC subunit C [Candidatus Staskawiczbacteria bacterium RIFOX
MEKRGYIYILTNNTNTVSYTGITSNLQKRIFEHKEKLVEGFTKRYNVSKLVYFEQFDNIKDAIKREKQIKGGSRQDKINLIKSINPELVDLYNNL